MFLEEMDSMKKHWLFKFIYLLETQNLDENLTVISSFLPFMLIFMEL